METTIKLSTSVKNSTSVKSITLAEKFTSLCNKLESQRILLLSAMVLIQGCILVPGTLLVTSFIDLGLGGISVGLLGAGTVGVLVTNMSEAPIKAILITFALSVVSSILLIGVHLLFLN